MAVILNSHLITEYSQVNNENIEYQVLNIRLHIEKFVPKNYDF